MLTQFAAYIYKEKINCINKHRFGIFRFYDELPDRTYSRDEESDLMEVVMVDLKVLGDKVRCNQSSDDETVMLETIYNIQDAIKLMEQVYEVNLSGYNEEVHGKMSLMERLEEQKRVNEEQERELKEQKRANEEQKRVNEEQYQTIEQLKKLVAELQDKLQLSKDLSSKQKSSRR